jgi:hypothetical protein
MDLALVIQGVFPACQKTASLPIGDIKVRESQKSLNLPLNADVSLPRTPTADSDDPQFHKT